MKVQVRPRLKTLFIFDILLCYCVHNGRTYADHVCDSTTDECSSKNSKDNRSPIAAHNITRNNIIKAYNINDSNKNKNKKDANERFENSISDVRSLIMEKYGRHYRLNGDSSFDNTKSSSPDLADNMKKDNIPANSLSRTEDTANLEVQLDNGISDVKSIIMEKYGRHYRLTGGSTLATKRNKGEAVIIDVTNTSRSDNETVQPATNTSTITSALDTKNTSHGATPIVNKTTPLLPNPVNVNNVTVEKVSVHASNASKSPASKSEIGNLTESNKSINNATQRDKLNDTIIHLNATKNDSSLLVFGSPPQTGDSENNITEEGNLTTITIDLTKGNTSAVIPGLDVLKSPVSSVDVIVGNNKDGNAPKRSGTNLSKHKKHIVFQMSKPRTTITDFANKRKHVPHTRHKGGKHSSKHARRNKCSKHVALA